MSEEIKAAAARADEMIRQLAADANPEGADDQAEDGRPLTADETASAPTPVATTPAPEPAAPAVAPDETAALRAEVAHLRNEYGVEHQRYLSLQGMFQKSQTQIEQLNRILADMQAAPAAAFLSDDDETQFGPDLVDLATRAARHVMAESKPVGSDEVAALKAQIEKLNATVGGVQHDSAEAKFAAFCKQVETAVNASTNGRFNEINNSEAFKTWLTTSPARLSVFQAAASSHDLEGVLEFFNIYGIREGTNNQEKSTPPAVDPRLERQVAPGKSRSTPSQSSVSDGEKRQWTRSGIASFYAKKAEYPPESFTALEKDLFLAQSEGRVNMRR